MIISNLCPSQALCFFLCCVNHYHTCYSGIVFSSVFPLTPVRFLLQSMVSSMAYLRDVHQVCIPEILRFLLDLFKYNDNSKNKYSDNYYRAALVDAISHTVTPAATSISLLTGFVELFLPM